MHTGVVEVTVLAALAVGSSQHIKVAGHVGQSLTL